MSTEGGILAIDELYAIIERHRETIEHLSRRLKAKDDEIDILDINLTQMAKQMANLGREIERLHRVLHDIAYMEVNMLDSALIAYMRKLAHDAIASSHDEISSCQ